MFAIAMASMLLVAGDPVPQEAASLAGKPTRYCRELGAAPSRSQAIMICRTKAQWARTDACTGVTRYCAPSKRPASLSGVPGKMTAFALNEDSRIICKRLTVTGTRLTSQRTCLPQREWQRMWDESGGTMSSLQNRNSTPADQFGPR